MTDHEVLKSSAECAECKYRMGFQYGILVVPEDSDKDKAAMLLAAQSIAATEHLQAQKDAAYAAMEAAFGPEPIKYLTSGGIGTKFFASELTALADALLNGLGIPPQEHELQILTTNELRAQVEAINDHS